MDVNTIFPSKYVKASDLKGREVTVAIATCSIEKVGDGNKLVIYFQNAQKGMVCNRTNADRIANMYGPNTDLWTGREIVIFSELVPYQGRSVEGLRVKAPMRRVVAQDALQDRVAQSHQAPLETQQVQPRQSPTPQAQSHYPPPRQPALDPGLDDEIPF